MIKNMILIYYETHFNLTWKDGGGEGHLIILIVEAKDVFHRVSQV